MLETLQFNPPHVKGQGHSVKTSSDRQIIAPFLEMEDAEFNGDVRILIESSQLAVCAHARSTSSCNAIAIATLSRINFWFLLNLKIWDLNEFFVVQSAHYYFFKSKTGFHWTTVPLLNTNKFSDKKSIGLILCSTYFWCHRRWRPLATQSHSPRCSVLVWMPTSNISDVLTIWLYSSFVSLPLYAC